MNKHQEALSSISFTLHYRVKPKTLGRCEDENLDLLQELVDKVPHYEKLEERAKPRKLIQLPITTHDEIIIPKYTYKIEKVMCDKCGLTSFVVDNHHNQFKFCKQCGQAVDWSDFE